MNYSTLLKFRSVQLMTLFVAAITLSACSSPPKPPSLQLQAAEMAISDAEQDVANYPSPELSEARQKLTAARSAVVNEEMIIAARLADESRVNAELATAKADAAKASAINIEMQQGVDTLNLEMQRSQRVIRSQDINRSQDLQRTQPMPTNTGAY